MAVVLKERNLTPMDLLVDLGGLRRPGGHKNNVTRAWWGKEAHETYQLTNGIFSMLGFARGMVWEGRG